MTADAYLTLGVVALTLAALVGTRIPTDVTLVGAVALLMLLGILSPDEALNGMGEIRDVLFGSVSNHVLHHVTCPVLLI